MIAPLASFLDSPPPAAYIFLYVCAAFPAAFGRRKCSTHLFLFLLRRRRRNQANVGKVQHNHIFVCLLCLLYFMPSRLLHTAHSSLPQARNYVQYAIKKLLPAPKALDM